MSKIPRALTIAGSDSGGGAGIQADLKTFTALGVFGMTVITSVTAQNTEGVFGIYDLPADFVVLQLDVVLRDIGVDAVKTGMLSNRDIISRLAESIRRHKIEKLVVDPVMVAKSGDPLLKKDAIHGMIKEILPLAFCITPNIMEAEVITGKEIKDLEDMRDSCKQLIDLGTKSVVLKGGHIETTSESIDLFYDGEEFIEYRGKRYDTPNTHGTGCTFSSAICAYLAKGLGLKKAVKEAKEYIEGAIKNSLSLGRGHGPLNHIWRIREI